MYFSVMIILCFNLSVVNFTKFVGLVSCASGNWQTIVQLNQVVYGKHIQDIGT